MMLIYLDQYDAWWLKDLIGVYTTVVERDESNKQRAKKIIQKLDEGLKDYQSSDLNYIAKLTCEEDS